MVPICQKCNREACADEYNSPYYPECGDYVEPVSLIPAIRKIAVVIYAAFLVLLSIIFLLLILLSMPFFLLYTILEGILQDIWKPI